jgi:ribosomal protein L29
MDIKEIREKTDLELQNELKALREKVREMRFKVHFQEVKNLKEVSMIKKQVAQILTTLKERAK